ncbi:MAG: ATP-binding protein, partial [Thermodesulfobacteriota bacterium]|nr:ATP-binding protein [Thermodesulfobacteriota bacterium]
GVAFLFFYLLVTTVIDDLTDKDLLEQAEKFTTILTTRGIEAVKRTAVAEAKAAGEKKVFFRILSRYGEVFFSSNMSYWKDINVSGTSIKHLFKGSQRVFDTIVIPGRRDEVRILYKRIGTGGVMQLGLSMENQTRFIEAFKKIFITTMGVLIVLSILVGWFMARRALSGLGEVTRTATHISEGALEKRVPLKRSGDEIDQLATTFNQMLDRIQDLVTGIREMSDNIAHDLKSPIAGIRGSAEIALTTDTSLSEYKDMAASTIEECDRLLDMINTMLVISETEAGVGILKHEEIDMSKVVRDACSLFEPLAEEKKIHLSFHVQGTNMFSGDVRMIQRMIANILDNAIKYTHPGGNVDVSVQETDSRGISVAIKDTGIGISENDIGHVFERFYRCDPSRSQKGIGLGLSLAKAIAQAHGGDLGVKSRLGQGSTFIVTLPRLHEI